MYFFELRKKKLHLNEASPKHDKNTHLPKVEPVENDMKHKVINGNVNKVNCESIPVDSNYNSVKDVRTEYEERKHETAVHQSQLPETPKKQEECKRIANNKTPTHERRASRVDGDCVSEKQRRMSMRTEISEPDEAIVCHRRVSMGGNRTPKKKSECGTHVVAKSELWDTGNQHRCMKTHQKSSRVSISQDEGTIFSGKSYK